MPKRQTSFNPEWTKEQEFISKSSRDAFHGFCALCCFEVYLCISIISRSTEMLCFQALCQIICLCIYFISRSTEMLCFQALCQIICLFMYFFYFQKYRDVMFSGTVSDYLFIYVFLLFPEVQRCYVFGHCVRLFVYVFLLFPEVQRCYVFRHCALCKTGSSQWSVFETDITMSWINTNTVNKHFFASSVTLRSTSRYIVEQIVWQWIEWAISESLYHDTIDMMDTFVLYLRVHQGHMQLFLPH